MSRYAQLQTLSADLATEFGFEWATKLFGEEAITSLPVRSIGKNKGKPKGFVIWRKATSAGYCREVCGPLAVGGFADAWIGVGSFSSRRDAVEGRWLGRVQPLGSSFSTGVFFEEGRARRAAEQAADQARWEEEKAELLATAGG